MPHQPSPPGPKDKGYIGSLLGALSFKRSPLEHLMRYNRQYGDIVRFRLGGFTIYQINNPAHIEHVFNSPDLFIKDTLTPQSQRFRRVFRDGILVSEGDSWSFQRKLAEPAFSASQIAHYGETIVALASEMVEEWQSGETRDIYQEFRLLNRGIVSKIFLGSDSDEFGLEVSAILERMIDYANTAPGIFQVPEKIPTPGNLRLRRDVARLDEILYPIIQRRRKATGNSNDLLTALLEAREEDGSQLSDKQIRDAVVNFFVPARENVSIALAWAWYLISLQPKVEEILHNELDTVLGGRAPRPQDVPRLSYTTKIVMEILRLYPPIWRVARQVRLDTALGDFFIPAGSLVLISQWVVHHNPDYFSDPDSFDPSRWDSEKIRSMPQYAYFPFGSGVRICIGRNVALAEAVLVLATIAQQYFIRTIPGQKVSVDLGIVLRPKHGIQAIIKKRTPPA